MVATAADVLPDPPSFSEEQIAWCEKNNHYIPLLFEWYKYVGGLNVVTGNILRNSPGYKKIPNAHYHLLIGLLNRSSRLILANVALSHEGKFGETTAIVDRCIFETAVKILWLCTNPTDEKFRRMYATGLKPEVEFKKLILEAVESNNGQAKPIEDRMLTSIENHFLSAELTEDEIQKEKKVPPVDQMMDELGFHRIYYVVAQRIGSHAIHGNWADLLRFYLESDDNGGFSPTSGPIETNINQFMYIPLFVLRALSSYVYHVLDSEEARAFSMLFASTRDEILKVYFKAIGDVPEVAPWTRMSHEQ